MYCSVDLSVDLKRMYTNTLKSFVRSCVCCWIYWLLRLSVKFSFYFETYWTESVHCYQHTHPLVHGAAQGSLQCLAKVHQNLDTVHACPPDIQNTGSSCTNRKYKWEMRLGVKIGTERVRTLHLMHVFSGNDIQFNKSLKTSSVIYVLAG